MAEFSADALGTLEGELKRKELRTRTHLTRFATVVVYI